MLSLWNCVVCWPYESLLAKEKYKKQQLGWQVGGVAAHSSVLKLVQSGQACMHQRNGQLVVPYEAGISSMLDGSGPDMYGNGMASLSPSQLKSLVSYYQETAAPNLIHSNTAQHSNTDLLFSWPHISAYGNKTLTMIIYLSYRIYYCTIQFRRICYCLLQSHRFKL